MIIKNIAAANKTNPEERISASHERIEINKHEKSPTIAMIDERNISPGQLELQRRVAQAQLQRTTTTNNVDSKAEPKREVNMAKRIEKISSSPSRTRRQQERAE